MWRHLRRYRSVDRVTNWREHLTPDESARLEELDAQAKAASKLDLPAESLVKELTGK